MVAMKKEFAMSQRFGSRQRFATNLCGPYACDEIDETRVTCYLEIAHSRLAVDIPASLVEQCRAGAQGDIFLRLPGQRVAHVEPAPLLSDAEQKAAKGWSAEMSDFDRF